MFPDFFFFFFGIAVGFCLGFQILIFDFEYMLLIALIIWVKWIFLREIKGEYFTMTTLLTELLFAVVAVE